MDTVRAIINASTKYEIVSMAVICGEDISVTVCGGKRHVGAVSLACYEPERHSATVSTMTVFSHRDDAVSAYFAKNISREMRCTVSVSAGLHIDGASAEDIELLRRGSVQCCRLLIEELKARVNH